MVQPKCWRIPLFSQNMWVCVLSGLLLSQLLFVESFPHPVSRTSTTTASSNRRRRSKSTIPLWMIRPIRRPDDDHDAYFSDNHALEPRLGTDRPTQTRPEAPGTDIAPSKPKIVVLGASGMIGRRVVRQLLDGNDFDGTVVAFVRDYDKACRVLYDDLVVANRQVNGPKLEIVQVDLVAAHDLPDVDNDNNVIGEMTMEDEWRQTAASAASFYGNTVADYDDGSSDANSDNRFSSIENDPNEALEAAIRDCGTVISCVGSVRPSNVWTDFVARPFVRLLRPDVSGWCRDARHPYYVHYHTTRKALDLAEREQSRREALAGAMEGQENEGIERRRDGETPPRIRFIRISDLVVAQPAWQLIPLLTNMFHSMVFRYQDMAERALLSSTLVDTITLRAGDLVDDERNVETTHLQVDPFGHVESPARVGRDDVAELAVAAALVRTTQNRRRDDSKLSSVLSPSPPFHYTLACRWVGDDMAPFPPQGCQSDGHAEAHVCVKGALKILQTRDERRQKRRDKLKIADSPQRSPWRQRKPYGLCVAIPLYLGIFFMAQTLLSPVIGHVPGASLVQPIYRRMLDASALFANALLQAAVGIGGRIPALPKWIPRRYPKYISF